MGDALFEECGVTLVCLKKPLDHYKDPRFALEVQRSLLSKMHNRGQDAAGLTIVNHAIPRGHEYMFRQRVSGPNPEEKLFDTLDAIIDGRRRFSTVGEVNEELHRILENDPELYLREAIEHFLLNNDSNIFTGRVSIGHLRWGTQGKFDIGAAHPKRHYSGSACEKADLGMNGNFANNNEQLYYLESRLLWPTSLNDTETLVLQWGYFQKKEHDRVQEEVIREAGPVTKDNLATIEKMIEERMDYRRVAEQVYSRVDGGFAMVGVTGIGDAFALRDPKGIRPFFFYEDDEILVGCSEPSHICDAEGVRSQEISELAPGNILTFKDDGNVKIEEYAEPCNPEPCHFEPIYFAKDNSVVGEGEESSALFRQRNGKVVGEKAYEILRRDGIDIQNAVYAAIPNSGIHAADGLVRKIRDLEDERIKEELVSEYAGRRLGEDALGKIIDAAQCNLVEREYALKKDKKFRTYTLQANRKKALTQGAYDIVEDMIEDKTVVVVDDSIVQGNTLENSVIGELFDKGAEEVYVVSSEPMIKFPCPYGVAMSVLERFVVFRAVKELAEESGLVEEINELIEKAKEEEAEYKALLDDAIWKENPIHKIPFEFNNYLRQMYDMFNEQDICNKIAEIVTPERYKESKKGKVHIIYQSPSGLREALGKGDRACFGCTEGVYPTKGGYRCANAALVRPNELPY